MTRAEPQNLLLTNCVAEGKPNPDRTWTECFAQLVGTVLSLWDAAELDAAGEDGEVLPKFINLTDASIKMVCPHARFQVGMIDSGLGLPVGIESLPTRSNDEQPLQHILSLSTAGRNRYLLHFNSHHSLIQWTAGIRLAMYEHSTLQEAYTGALIAGKGKSLNNINVIMERSRMKSEQWVRVRFGAGVPWRRCWCVISPPDEKEYQRLQKELKKRSPYDRSHSPVLKGHIKFYDTKKDGKKQKKAQPIATITDAYSAYAIYPQAKSLVDASTLLKIEGNVTVHADPPSSTEGFIFIMPEVHPAVSGFEMLLRFLFPTWDAYALYGRPGRLVASILDPRSLMFAMPKHKKYGYLETLDVSTLILEDNSSTWAEREWRKRLKDATGTRMNALEDGTRSHSRSANPNLGSRSELHGPNGSPQRTQLPLRNGYSGRMTPGETASSDEEFCASPPPPMHNLEAMRSLQSPEPVSPPPAFNHASQDHPTSKAYHSPELRRANSRLSNSTLAQMVNASGLSSANNPQGQYPTGSDGEDGVYPGSTNYSHDRMVGFYARNGDTREDQTIANQDRQPRNHLSPPALDIPNQRSRSPMGPPSPYGLGENSRPGTSDSNRPPHPPGQGGPPRSPNPHQQGFRPDQAAPSPGPGGPPGSYGRGRPPPGQRPPPNGAPGQHANMRPGPGGRGGPPPGHAHRKPVPRQTNSITPDHIIDHYTSDSFPGGAPVFERRPAPPPHGQGPAFGGSNGLNDEERPRAGVLKTVAGGEPPLQREAEFNVPEVNFGPTLNYGAFTVSRKQPPKSVEHGATSQVSGNHCSEQKSFASGHQQGHARRESKDSVQRTMAWQPSGSYARSWSSSSSGGRALTPEQYVQHRALGPCPPFGTNPAGAPQVIGPRTATPQPLYPGAGRQEAGPPTPLHGMPGSLSRPMGPPSPRMPPQGQYGPGQVPAHDEDISDIICLLYPHSPSARQEVQRLAEEDSPHIIGKHEADGVQADYELEDDASRFASRPVSHGSHAIILKLSSLVKNPAAGFAFGRNCARCDVVFVNDPLRRVSNVHFRIYVNEYGNVMIEDQSTNGTLVDQQLLTFHPKDKRSQPANKWVLSSGNLIKILLHNEHRDLSFLVRIPRRDDSYDRAYIAKVGEYFARNGLHPPNREPPSSSKYKNNTSGGPIDIFKVPGAPLIRKAGIEASPSPHPSPSKRKESHPSMGNEWKGSGKYNRIGTIGKGAFAVVYKVTSKYDGLPYAAKEIEKRRFIKNGVLDQKVENEMRIMQRVQHVRMDSGAHMAAREKNR
ncbi:hypothetical protein UVI_02049410 [Ustilaginoidea virens]|uniref:Uncharacterized protein n=1 Tax=Ustilaginoidea virens TaxID=1159556 RepID=A0A1B5L2U2_USTVR|nr:hypothetical protein UVI_02049410 [Ustilaginoidea virens]